MACTGCNDGCLDSVELAEGQQGLFGGFSGLWRKNAGTASTVSAGGLTFNNTNMISATAIYVHKTNADNKNYTNFLNSFSNGGNYGLIRIFQEDDNTVFWYGTLTGVSLGGNVFTLTVTNIQSSLSSGTIPSNRDLVLSFTPRGTASTSGTFLLHSSVNNSSTSSGVSSEALKSYPLLPSTLAVNGDIIEVEAVVDAVGTAANTYFTFQLRFDGTALSTYGATLNSNMTRSIHLKATIIRVGASAQRVIKLVIVPQSSTNGSQLGNTTTFTYASNIDTTVALESGTKFIDVFTSMTNGTFTAGQVVCRSLIIKHIKQ